VARKKKAETVQATLDEMEESKKKTAGTKSKTVSRKTIKKEAKKKAEKAKPRAVKKTTKKKASKPRKKAPKSKKKAPEPKKVEADSRLMSLPGVGSKLAEKLAKAGYGSLDKLSRARSKSLAKKVDGLSPAGAKKLVSAAKETIKASTKPEPVSEKPEIQPEDDTSVEATPLSQLNLTDLPGVGAKLAKELERSGYNTVARISRSRPSSVAKVVDGLSLKRATVLVDAAIELVRDVEIQTVAAIAKPSHSRHLSKNLLKKSLPKNPRKKLRNRRG